MSTQAIVDAIYAKLTADQTSGSVYSDVGGRIYEMRAPQDAALPLLVFTVIPESVPLIASDNTDAEVQIDLWGHVRLGAKAIGDINDKLDALFNRVAITPTGSNAGMTQVIDPGLRTIEEDAVRITSRWKLFTN